MEELKYPIGKWKSPDTIDKIRCSNWINEIKDLPNQLKSTLSHINENDLQRKVVHHIADSHMNAYIRHKLSTTEDTPTINPYNEKLWSEMLDVKMIPIDVSLNLIENLHLRWAVFLGSLNETDLKKGFIHPQHNKKILLEESIGMYAWHGTHHLHHLKNALKFNY
jgi:hypothetical protein